MTETSFHTAVQLVVDSEKLLELVGWSETGYSHDGEPTMEGGPVNIKRDLAVLVAQQLAARVDGEMKSVIREAVSDVAREKVDTIIDEVIHGEIRKTNSFGEPTGAAFTLRELIIASATEQLNRKVTDRGETSRYGNDKTMPYIAYVARKEAAGAIDRELKDAVAEAVSEVKTVVKASVSTELAERIVKAVR